MCTRRALALVALLLAGSVAGPAAGATDEVLVVVLVDGLVPGCIDAVADVDGPLLMPATAAHVARSRRYTDVLTPSTDPGRARACLDSALAEFGAEAVRTVRSADPDTLGAALDALAERSGRQALVLDVPWLEPPVPLDEEVLARLDPAPWSSMSSSMEIESQIRRRTLRAQRLASLSGRGAGRGRETLLVDVEWVIRTAHAVVDARLGALLGRALDDPRLSARRTVVLTSTSSTGTGVRGWIGPFVGTALDVARVGVFVWSAGLPPGEDQGPRQWIGFGDDWFDAAVGGDRHTGSWGPERPREDPVCEMRWTTDGFTLIDATQPRLPPRLYDLRLDPGEWFDRAVAEPALADSLRRELRTRLYGAAPVVRLQAGGAPVSLRLACRSRLELVGGGSVPALLQLEPGQAVELRMVDGAETLGLGRTVEVDIAGRRRELSSLVLHSPAWLDAFGAPAGSGEVLGVSIR